MSKEKTELPEKGTFIEYGGTVYQVGDTSTLSGRECVTLRAEDGTTTTVTYTALEGAPVCDGYLQEVAA